MIGFQHHAQIIKIDGFYHGFAEGDVDVSTDGAVHEKGGMGGVGLLAVGEVMPVTAEDVDFAEAVRHGGERQFAEKREE